MSDFGEYLRSLREERGLSRPQLRDRIRDRFGDSFSTGSLLNWENGHQYPPADDLAKLIVVLKADYDAVFSRLVAETRGRAAKDAPAPRGGSPQRRNARAGGGGGARQRGSGSGRGRQ